MSIVCDRCGKPGLVDRSELKTSSYPMVGENLEEFEPRVEYVCCYDVCPACRDIVRAAVVAIMIPVELLGNDKREPLEPRRVAIEPMPDNLDKLCVELDAEVVHGAELPEICEVCKRQVGSCDFCRTKSPNCVRCGKPHHGNDVSCHDASGQLAST